jgi:hypothetical protein
MSGGKSEAYFHVGARSLAATLPRAEHHVLDGQHHGSVVMGSKVIAGELRRFYGAGSGVGAAAAGSIA